MSNEAKHQTRDLSVGEMITAVHRLQPEAQANFLAALLAGVYGGRFPNRDDAWLYLRNIAVRACDLAFGKDETDIQAVVRTLSPLSYSEQAELLGELLAEAALVGKSNILTPKAFVGLAATTACAMIDERKPHVLS